MHFRLGCEKMKLMACLGMLSLLEKGTQCLLSPNLVYQVVARVEHGYPILLSRNDCA